MFTASDGVAVRLDGAITPFVQSSGTIDSRTSSLGKQIDDINDQRAALDLRLLALEDRLLEQFIAMDALVSQLQATSSFLDQQFSILQGLSARMSSN